MPDREDCAWNFYRSNTASLKRIVRYGFQIQRQNDCFNRTAFETTGRNGRIVDLCQIDRFQSGHGAHEVVVERVEFPGQFQPDQFFFLIRGNVVFQRPGRFDMDCLVSRSLLGEQNALGNQPAVVFQIDGRVTIGGVRVGLCRKGECLLMGCRACFSYREPCLVGFRNLYRVGYVGFYLDLHRFSFCGDFHGVGRNEDDAFDKIEDAHDGVRPFGYKDQHPACSEIRRRGCDDDFPDR